MFPILRCAGSRANMTSMCFCYRNYFERQRWHTCNNHLFYAVVFGLSALISVSSSLWLHSLTELCGTHIRENSFNATNTHTHQTSFEKTRANIIVGGDGNGVIRKFVYDIWRVPTWCQSTHRLHSVDGASVQKVAAFSHRHVSQQQQQRLVRERKRERDGNDNDWFFYDFGTLSSAWCEREIFID